MLGLNLIDCNRCSLRQGCGQVVWGNGPFPAKIMIVGENPSDEDDLIGRPFLSREGMLLKKILRQADINIEDVYLTMAVKCMSGKVKPNDSQINTCASHLWKEFKVVQPKVVVALGGISNRLLLGLKKSFKLSEHVGQFNKVEYLSGYVASWYSMNHVLQRGAKVEKQTLDFFKSIKEKSLVQ